jgi:Zn-finger protein
MSKKNQDIKKLMRTYKVFTWECADELGIHENTLYRLLRKELPDETKERIYKAVQRVREGKDMNEAGYGQ